MSSPADPLWLDSLTENALSVDQRSDKHKVRMEDGVALVPSSQCMTLALPYLPKSRRELVAIIGHTAPLQIEKLSWTEPVVEEGGKIRAIIVRRDWLDQFVEDIERAGIEVERVYAEGHRLLFDYRTPAQRRRRVITGVFWIGAAMAAFAAMLNLSGKTTPDLAHLSSTANSAPLPLESFSFNPLTTDVLSVSRLANSNIELSRIERLRNGSVLLEIRSIEPDGMREAIAEQGLLPHFEEASQKVGPGGEYLVEYRRKVTGTAPLSPLAEFLRADNPADATTRVREVLESYAQSSVVQINLASPAREQARLLTFPFELVGPQDDVLNMAERIESTPPPMRFAEWSLSPAPEGVRLSGLLYVPWQITSS